MINPCGFPLLPAFLAYYLGADEERLPAAPTRVLQGLVVGGLVALGFLGFFALVGLPVSFGAGAIANAVPWLGLATGVALTLCGLAALAGRRIEVGVHLRLPVRRERRVGAMLLFGAGYGAASLGCTLPIFLTVVGASLGADKLAVFLAYGAGMTLVLMALAVGVALARQGITNRLRPLLPQVGRLAALLLVLSGVYLTYFWARIRFGNTVTLADDPIVGFAGRYSAQLANFANDHSTAVLIVAAVIVALALATALRHLLRRSTPLSKDIVHQ